MLIGHRSPVLFFPLVSIHYFIAVKQAQVRVSVASEMFQYRCFSSPETVFTPHPCTATFHRHVVEATTETPKHHLTGREDRHAPPSSVTRHHRHGLHAPRHSRRARRVTLRGYQGLCRRHQSTKPSTSGTLLEVQLLSCPRRQAAILWTLRRCVLLQQDLIGSQELIGSQSHSRLTDLLNAN